MKNKRGYILTCIIIAGIVFVLVIAIRNDYQSKQNVEIIEEWLERSEYKDEITGEWKFGWKIDLNEEKDYYTYYLELKDSKWLKIGLKYHWFWGWKVDEDSVIEVNDVNGKPEDLVDK